MDGWKGVQVEDELLCSDVSEGSQPRPGKGQGVYWEGPAEVLLLDGSTARPRPPLLKW